MGRWKVDCSCRAVPHRTVVVLCLSVFLLHLSCPHAGSIDRDLGVQLACRSVEGHASVDLHQHHGMTMTGTVWKGMEGRGTESCLYSNTVYAMLASMQG